MVFLTQLLPLLAPKPAHSSISINSWSRTMCTTLPREQGPWCGTSTLKSRSAGLKSSAQHHARLTQTRQCWGVCQSCRSILMQCTTLLLGLLWEREQQEGGPSVRLVCLLIAPALLCLQTSTVVLISSRSCPAVCKHESGKVQGTRLTMLCTAAWMPSGG